MKLKNLFFYKTLLHYAVKYGNLEIVEELLSQNDVDVNLKVILNE